MEGRVRHAACMAIDVVLRFVHMPYDITWHRAVIVAVVILCLHCRIGLYAAWLHTIAILQRHLSSFLLRPEEWLEFTPPSGARTKGDICRPRE